MDKLKPYAKQIIKNMFNNLKIETKTPNITDEDVYINIEKLFNFINNSDYAISTKRDYLIVLSNVFKNSIYTELREFLYKKAKLYDNEHFSQEQCQKLDKNELKNYVDYNQLQDKLKKIFNTYELKPTLKNIQKVLMLALYVLQPPLRNDYNDLKIINNDDEISDDNNYLLRHGEKYYIIINNDKVIKKHNTAEIPILNTTLKNILDLYIDVYIPNNIYLFQTKNNKPYTKRQTQNLINGLFKDENKILTFHNLRSAYITHFYKNNLDIQSRNILADKMRHSRQTAELVYCKFL
jgi:integrase